MFYIPDDSLDPRFNLALEEYVLRGPPAWWPDQKDDLADALGDHYPEEIIGYYKARVERLLAIKPRNGYRDVADYVKKVGRLYTRLGRPDDFRSYVGDLRLAYARRPTLMKQLDRLDRV